MDNDTVTLHPTSNAAPLRIEKKGSKSRRRFPGPAGLLPALTPNQFVQIDSPIRTRNTISDEIDEIITAATYSVPLLTSSQLLSQDDGSLFQDSPWSTLLAQLELNTKDQRLEYVMHLMNINWVLTKAIKLPKCNKIPFLTAVLQETNHEQVGRIGRFATNGNSNVTLVDPTGTIEASVDPDFLAAYTDELNSGTALALKNVGILQFKRKVILTVTESNVICMTSKSEFEDYEKPKPNKQRRTLKSFVTENDVRVSHFCDFNPDQMIKDFHVMNHGILNGELNDDEDDDDESQEIENRLGNHQPNLFSSTCENVNFKNPPQLSALSYENSATKFSFQKGSDPMPTLNNYFKTTVVPPKQHVTSAAPTFDVDMAFENDDDDEFFRALDESVLTQGKIIETGISVAQKSFLVTPHSRVETDTEIVELGHKMTVSTNSFTEGELSAEDDNELLLPQTSVRDDGNGEMEFENDDDDIFAQCDENYNQAIETSFIRHPNVNLHSSLEDHVSHPPFLELNSEEQQDDPGEVHEEEEVSFDDDDDEFFKILEGIGK